MQTYCYLCERGLTIDHHLKAKKLVKTLFEFVSIQALKPNLYIIFPVSKVLNEHGPEPVTVQEAQLKILKILNLHYRLFFPTGFFRLMETNTDNLQ